MKKIIILLVLLFNLVPYYYQGSLNLGINLNAQTPYGEERTARCTYPGHEDEVHPYGQCPYNGGYSYRCPCCDKNDGTCGEEWCWKNNCKPEECAPSNDTQSKCECCGDTECDIAGRFCNNKGISWDLCAMQGGVCDCCGLQYTGCNENYCVTNGKTIYECSIEPCPCCKGTCKGGFCSLYGCAKSDCPATPPTQSCTDLCAQAFKCDYCGKILAPVTGCNCGDVCPRHPKCCLGEIGCTINHCAEAPKCTVPGCGKIITAIPGCSCGDVCPRHLIACGCGHIGCPEKHFTDKCNQCVGGNTGLQPCRQPQDVDCSDKSVQNANDALFIYDRAAWHGDMYTLKDLPGTANEHSNSLFKNGDTYTASGIKSGGPNSVSYEKGTGLVAVVHTHNDEGFNCFSLGDFYSFAEDVMKYPTLKDFYLIAEDGTEYVMHLQDPSLLKKFIDKYPRKDNYVSSSNGPDFNPKSVLSGKYYLARWSFEDQQFIRSDAYAYAMANVLFNSETGVKLLKFDSSDNKFKEINTSREKSSNTNDFNYHVTKCK